MEKKELESYYEQEQSELLEHINRLTLIAIVLGCFWVGFAILTIILSCAIKNGINISAILISNAIFLILFISNIVILALLWRKESRRKEFNRKIKEKYFEHELRFNS